MKMILLICFILIGCNNHDDHKLKINQKWFDVEVFNIRGKSIEPSIISDPLYNSYYEEIIGECRIQKFMSTCEDRYTNFSNSYTHREIQFMRPIFSKPIIGHINFYNTLICIDTTKNKAFYIIWFNYKRFELKENWGIGKWTDSVFSNLEINDFKSLYPDFKGKYNYNLVEKIIINNKYKINDLKFYYDIRFVGFDERHYHQYPDSAENKFVIPRYKL